MGSLAENMIKSIKQGDMSKTVSTKAVHKGVVGRKNELAEELDGAEAAYLQDLKTIRTYRRAMDVLKQEMKVPDIVNNAVHFTMMQGRLNSLKVKYDNAKADAVKSNARASDLRNAYEQCPIDRNLQTPPVISNSNTSLQRTLTMAADAVKDLARHLT